jgi:hypothetical protein
MITVL